MPTFFPTPLPFRKWLRKNHQKATELVVGFHKVHTGKPSISWSQAVDEALCFGWIDGVRTSIDADTYQVRFTPRKPNSTWSAVNIKKMETLIRDGRMQPAGLESYNNRNIKKANLYAHEKKSVQLPPAYLKQLKANKKAWSYFKTLAPSYQKSSVNWIVGAQQEATQLKRLQQLIAESEAGTNPFKDNKYMKKK